MANKLREVFSKKERFINGTIRFKDNQSYRGFLKALKTVYEKGELVKVNGVESVSWGVDCGTTVFPMDNYDKIANMTVGPSCRLVNLSFCIDGEDKDFQIDFYQIKDGCVVKTKNDFPFPTEIIFDEQSQKAKFKMRPDFERANSIIDLMDSISVLKELLNYFFGIQSRQITELDLVFHYLEELFILLEKLHFIEEKFNRAFVPSSVDLKDLESIGDLNELWFLLNENKAIRINGKLRDATSEGIRPLTDLNIHEGQIVDMTYISEMEFSLWGETIQLHCANLLRNALITSVEDLGENNIRVHYGEKESNPVYVSYRGFVSEEEAKEELEVMAEHIEDYINAKTVVQYMRDLERNHV